MTEVFTPRQVQTYVIVSTIDVKAASSLAPSADPLSADTNAGMGNSLLNATFKQLYLLIQNTIQILSDLVLQKKSPTVLVLIKFRMFCILPFRLLIQPFRHHIMSGSLKSSVTNKQVTTTNWCLLSTSKKQSITKECTKNICFYCVTVIRC